MDANALANDIAALLERYENGLEERLTEKKSRATKQEAINNHAASIANRMLTVRNGNDQQIKAFERKLFKTQDKDAQKRIDALQTLLELGTNHIQKEELEIELELAEIAKKCILAMRFPTQKTLPKLNRLYLVADVATAWKSITGERPPYLTSIPEGRGSPFARFVSELLERENTGISAGELVRDVTAYLKKNENDEKERQKQKLIWLD